MPVPAPAPSTMGVNSSTASIYIVAREYLLTMVNEREDRPVRLDQ